MPLLHENSSEDRIQDCSLLWKLNWNKLWKEWEEEIIK